MTEQQTSGPLVGRDDELGELLSGLDDAASGQGRLYLLGGEPGIGKSRLADEVASRARERDHIVLWGRGWEDAGAPPYWPWVQVLRSYARKTDAGVVRRQMGAGAGDIAQMLPELHELFDDLDRPTVTDSDAARFQLFDSTTTFLRNAATDRRLLIVIDDLQAADTPSIRYLRFLASQLSEIPLLVLGTYRDFELTPEHPLTSAITELTREPITRTITLKGLDRDALRLIIGASLGAEPDDRVVAAVARGTKGNPLYVGEGMRLLSAEGRLSELGQSTHVAVPAGVRAVIGRRLARLMESTRDVLSIGAVVGPEFGVDLLHALTDTAPAELLDALDEAVREGVLVGVSGTRGLRFSHDLVRETLYGDLGPGQRMRLHRRVAEGLEELHGHGSDDHLAQLAHHFSQAASGGGAEKAVAYARRAGDRAALMLAFEESARLYEMALHALEETDAPDEETRCRLLLALGDALARGGDLAGAKQTFLRAADMANRLSMPDLLGAAALGYGGRFVWAKAGEDPQLVRLLRQGVAACGAADGALRARLLARLAGALRDEPPRELAADVSQKAVEIARRVGDPSTLAYALVGQYAATWWPENPEERLSIASELLELAGAAGDTERMAEGLDLRIAARMELGQIQAVDADLASMGRLVEILRQPAHRWVYLHTRAMRALFDGRFEAASELIQEALIAGQDAQRWDAQMTFRLQTFILRREQGRLEEMETVIRSSVAEYPSLSTFPCMLAHLYCELDRPDEARHAFETVAADDFSAVPRRSDWLFAMSLLPEVVECVGDGERAGRLYALLHPFAGRVATIAPEVSTGSASRSLGLLASIMSRWDEAAQHFDEALSADSRMGARPGIAHTQYDYARMLIARDRPGDSPHADALLTEALETCQALGMVALGTKTSTLLQAHDRSRETTGGAESASSRSRAGLQPRVFRNEGEYWSVRFEGDAFRLRESKGLRYLAALLRVPGQQVLALDLVVGQVSADRRRRGPHREETTLHSAVPPGAGALLDPRAKAEYRQRLVELEQEISEAHEWGDAERASRARYERDFLTQELSRALGLGGRDRPASSDVERARLSVTKAIKSAMDRIRSHSPLLAGHLASTVQTGTFCSYNPDPSVPATWQL